MDTKTKQVAEAMMNCLMHDTRAVDDYIDSSDLCAVMSKDGDCATFIMYKWDEKASAGHSRGHRYVAPGGQYVYTVTIEGKYIPHTDE